MVSHDRELLRRMERIVELSPLGLRSYGGNYDHYVEHSERERADAARELLQRKAERRRGERQLRDARELAERREARGRRGARHANQAPILLGRQKQRSETTAGRMHERQAAQRAELDERVTDAALRVDQRASPFLHVAPGTQAPFRLAQLDDARLAHLSGPCATLDLLVTSGQRIAVTGANGSGKSTLLRTLAGKLELAAGTRQAWAPMAYLDQHLADLAPEASVFDHLRDASPAADPGTLRMRLSHIGLDAAAVTRPSGQLSGGQRLAAGIALAIYAEPPAALLLLDEPGNHLDLPALQSLEKMLHAYDGALVVVSHDEVFLDRLRLNERLEATSEGWVRRPW